MVGENTSYPTLDTHYVFLLRQDYQSQCLGENCKWNNHDDRSNLVERDGKSGLTVEAETGLNSKLINSLIQKLIEHAAEAHADLLLICEINENAFLELRQQEQQLDLTTL